ncbi:flagellar protein FlaG [Marinobacter sp. C2H3]|uniref:flagellar protein FlaG n=1 Tax=Marinobacter sp. C2H3 TaxID=3119003 RepID=UPI00300E83B6
MNDVNLNSPDLRLVKSAAPAKALSSSPAQASPVASAQVGGANVVSPRPVSEAQKLETQAEDQRKQLDQAVSQLNDFVQNVQRDLQFEVDNELGQTVVKVVDQQTQEVIRQIPDEVALRLAKKLQQDEPLTLFNAKV